MKESKNFLILYAIVIAVLLVLILFVLPDDFFGKKYEQNSKEFIEAVEQSKEEQEKLENEKKKEFVDYEEQKNQILNGNYDYKYVILDSMGTKSYKFDCSGSYTKGVEVGSCKSPEVFSYTEKTKSEEFTKYVDNTYFEAKNIFNLIKNVEPSIETHNLYRNFTYNTKIKELDTEIIVQTTKDDISEIQISNPYMTYIIKYSNVNIDN